MHIGIAIRRIRKELKIPQMKLALDCGLSQTSLSQIENGKKKPSQRTIDKICEVLTVPEMLLYITGMEEEDIPESKRHIYRLLYPSIMSLTLQLISSEYYPRQVPEKG